MNEIKERIHQLRSWLARHGAKAFIIPSDDPHMSEYTAPHWKSREWISGFTGSAGTVVVTADAAGLWTDSRYFLQAAAQLEGSGIDLYKMKIAGTPSIGQFLCQKLEEGDSVGIDGNVMSACAARTLATDLEGKGIKTTYLPDPMDELWAGRPAIPDGKAFVLDMKYAGESATDKIERIRKSMGSLATDGLWVSALDEIAWALNLRGNDVHCNPVVICHMYIDKDSAHLFIYKEKLDDEVADHLKSAGVTIHPYESAVTFIDGLAGKSIIADPNKTNANIYNAITRHNAALDADPIPAMKAIRNAVEADGVRNSMVRDGVALVKFNIWLEQAVKEGTATEIGIADKLHELRSAQPLYVGESFDTIAGYGEHGAIVHYEATPETDVHLQPKGFVLIDSGAQYLDGTTDITRTISLGTLTEEERTDYTLILKGHIELAMAVFPEGTRGAQLDVLARQPIWKRHMNFLHGTGHGVGSFLNVHEGPQSIRMEENPTTIKAGMLTSDEPGVYKAGQHGIRTENLLLAVPDGEGMFGNYLRFETVTLCPIDTKPIIKGLLDKDETEWLNTYHHTIYGKLSPYLDETERAWLAQATKEI